MLHPRHVVHIVLRLGLLRLCIARRLALRMVFVGLWTARRHHTLHAVHGVVLCSGRGGTWCQRSKAEGARNRECKRCNSHLFLLALKRAPEWPNRDRWIAWPASSGR